MHPLEQENGTTKDVQVNEFKCCWGAAMGNKMPSEAGIRIGNEKFVFVKHDPETKTTYMTRRGGGGGCISKLESGIVIGIWLKDEMMSKGGVQNQADCAAQVENMANFLRKHKY